MTERQKQNSSAERSDSVCFERRVEVLCDQPPNASGQYVLYWMTAARRSRSNFALQRAVEWAMQLSVPLMVLEPLRLGYRCAGDRFHAFVIEGMRENARQFAKAGFRYLPYVEQKADAGKGLLAELSKRASVVVGDDYPIFFLPKMRVSAAKQVHCRFESVDAACILPMRLSEKPFARAYDFRRFMQKNMRWALERWPVEDPLMGQKKLRGAEVAESILQRWPMLSGDVLAGGSEELDSFVQTLPLDHSVARARHRVGGSSAAQSQLDLFVSDRLSRYADDRAHPDQDASSGLSPWLHFGHIGPHEVFDAVRKAEGWWPMALAEKVSAKREGWWGMSAGAESFMDEFITWRELGYHFCHHRDDADSYDGLPDWAKLSLSEHEGDPRWAELPLDQLEGAQTDDPLWNAAQRQLVRDGIIHNALRMLWGKKVIGWSKTPREAFERLLYLNDKYALDGRDPNSYSGIGWVFGRFDRAWGPEREIFGKIRYMTSESSAKKWKLKGWLEQYGPKQAELFER